MSDPTPTPDDASGWSAKVRSAFGQAQTKVTEVAREGKDKVGDAYDHAMSKRPEETQPIAAVGAAPSAGTRSAGTTAAGTAGLGIAAAGTSGAATAATVARAASATAATGGVGSVTARTQPVAVSRRTRKARLRISRIDPWSVMKTSFLFSMAAAIIFFIATWVTWSVIQQSGVFASVNKAVSDLTSSPTLPSSFKLENWVNTNKVLGFAAIISAIDVVILTALVTLFSFLYNLAAAAIGGLEVTLAED